MKRYPITLAIDTSCDDTSAAVTCGLEIWSNVIASQTELHRPYGGVFPTVAKQAHRENIAAVVRLALKRAGIAETDIEQIAVTIGPGLAPALEVGIAFAKQLATRLKIPVVPVNHIEGHYLSVLALPQTKAKLTESTADRAIDARKSLASTRSDEVLDAIQLPVLSVVVSGGHTQFFLIEATKSDSVAETNRSRLHTEANTGTKVARYPRLAMVQDDQDATTNWLTSGRFSITLLGQSVDDAAGEALDKIGRMMNLGYPAGPVIEQLAVFGNPNRYQFPLPMTTTHDFNMSFSGMKTFARRFIETNWTETLPSKQETYDFCASLQYSIFRHICYKMNKILLKNPEIAEIWLGGGVAANKTLRKMIRQTLKSVPHKHRQLTLKTPYTKRVCKDNAGMVGVCCYSASSLANSA